ncbi:hypothetical protein [Dokdonella sp.]|uniref:hypothetical protein n=1 Tax=Dokdonella sp. TaxID=2291710 RepID=UPI003BB1A908
MVGWFEIIGVRAPVTFRSALAMAGGSVIRNDPALSGKSPARPAGMTGSSSRRSRNVLVRPAKLLRVPVLRAGAPTTRGYGQNGGLTILIIIVLLVMGRI